MHSRRRDPRNGALVALIIASAALHGAAALVAGALGGDGSEARIASDDHAPSAPGPACELAAAIAAGAREGLCRAPMVPDPRGCDRGPLRAWQLDLIQCRGELGPAPYLEPSDVEVALVDPDEAAAFARVPVDELVEPEPEPEPEIDRSAQVVEVPEPADSERPDEARYLAEFDSRVEEERVARGSTDEMVERPSDDGQRAAAEETERAESSETEADAEDDGERAGGDELAMREIEPAQRGLEGAIDAPGEEGALPALGESSPAREARGGEGGGPDLRPSDELLARVMEGTGGSVDRLEGVEEGERTALNAVQWKHASFFNRVKREVAQDWNPAKVYRRHDPDGSVYGLRERITVVRVWLTADGSLSRIVVLRKSGIDALDDEAVRAFRAAQPFPNPPSALVDEASQSLAFNFGFHFQIGGRGDRWRIFRSR